MIRALVLALGLLLGLALAVLAEGRRVHLSGLMYQTHQQNGILFALILL